MYFRKLKHTDEEVKQSFEDFYEDVHTEFLKFGELVNFKVCKNGSSHLRGNVYVHYKSLESAMLAYQSTNGRYFAGKLLTCEFINVTRWRVAICGEYMKSRFKSCSRGSACNFIHCFQNPGGDYEWADWDKPAPRYWLKKMAALFGYTGYDFTDEVGLRHHSRRSRSRGLDSPHRKSLSDEDDGYKRRRGRHSPHRGDGRETSNLDKEMQEERRTYLDHRCFKHRETDNVDVSEGSTDGHRSVVGMKGSSKKRERERVSADQDNKNRKVEAIKMYHSRRSRSRGLDSPHRKSCSDEDDGYKRRRVRYSPRRGDDRETNNLDREMQEERRTCQDSRFDISEGSTDGQGYVAGIKRSSKKRERERLFTDRDNKSRKVDATSSKGETAEGGVSDKNHEHKSRSSSRQNRAAESARECRHNNVDKSYGKKNNDEIYRYKDKRVTAKKNEAASLKCNSHGDSQDNEEDEHHSHSKEKSRTMKDEAESSSSASQCSDDSRLVEVEKRQQKKRRKSSRFKDKTRAQKDVRKSSRLQKQSGSTDSESDGDDDRHHRHSKQSHKSRRTRSRSKSKKESDLADTKRNMSQKSAPERDHKRPDEERMLQVYRSDDEATAPGMVATSLVHTSCKGIDNEAKTELEKACRLAALKKLEEIRMKKDTQTSHSREPVESLKICTKENIRVTEKADSSKVEVCETSIKRRRI